MNLLHKRLLKKGRYKLEKLKKNLQTKNFVDYGLGYQGAVFLTGTSRSGTTWFSDVINYNGQYRYMFEPFYEKENPLCKQFKEKQYIPTDNAEETFIKPVRQILSGKVRNQWTDRFNETIVSNKRLIKAIRANLFLPWLHDNFPELPIIFLLRHPCAVAASKMRLSWKRSLSSYLKQDALIKDFLKPFHQELIASEAKFQSVNDDFDNLIFIWCIENYVPLTQLRRFRKDKIHVVFYENCCINPEVETKRLFSYLKEDYHPDVLERLKKASKLSRADSAVFTGENLIDGWKTCLTEQQTKRAMEILDLFGLDQLYSQSLMPHTENLNHFI